jgi:2-oxoglutarate dehydrogenase E1 component
MQTDPMVPLDFLHLGNVEYLEQLHQQYQQDTRSLDPQWAAFFAGFEFGYGCPTPTTILPAGEIGAALDLPGKGAYALVNAYRHLGHWVVRLDPLGHHRSSHPLLELEEFGVSPDDLSRHVGAGGFLGPTDGTLHDLREKLQRTYCQTFGIEYMEIDDKHQRTWLQHQIEPGLNRPALAPEACRQILARLVAAEEFERFLQTRYIGHKRFSLEGGEALIPLLDRLIEEGAAMGVEEIVMGMPHRGRLNVLAHALHNWPMSSINRMR